MPKFDDEGNLIPDDQTPPVTELPTPNPQTPPVRSDAELMKDAQVKALVEAARKQEKDKLYKSLEAKDEQIKALGLKIDELENQLKDRDGANMEEIKRIEELLNTVQQQNATLLKQMDDQKAEADRERTESEAKRRVAELRAYKEAKLREAGDDLVIELVGGETEEEIDQSIELARTKFDEIAEKVKGKKGSEKPQIHNTPRVTLPSSEVRPITMEQVRKMSKEDYAKNRPAILEAAKSGQIQ